MDGHTAVEIVTGRQDAASVERLLRLLPDWFGIEESVEQYVRDAESKPTYLAVDRSGDVLGALLLTRHNPQSAEIHLLAVDPAHHRRGVGAALVRQVEADLVLEGVEVLEVKTQGPSEPNESYATTLKFYQALGFIPLEEIYGLWPTLPCLILVKFLQTAASP
ncbi:MAG: GNAT family N-acetyltransferase [Actinomycetes bacterium]